MKPLPSGFVNCPPHAIDFGEPAVFNALLNIGRPVLVISVNGRIGVNREGRVVFHEACPEKTDCYPLLAFSPALMPQDLGAQSFKNRHRVIYPYVVGAMAHGIASVELIRAAGRAGMIGFFGSAGMAPPALENVMANLKDEMGEYPFGMNLVYSGNTEMEWVLVRLFLKHDIHRISAAGFLKLTLPLLAYRFQGIHRASDGSVVCPNQIIAKTSRLEIARQFLSTPPEKMLRELVAQNWITPEQADLAANQPVAVDLTAEADSGGHTDNRAALSLLPSMIDLRDAIAKKFQYPRPPGIGLGGGIATPAAVAAAFTLGADYVLGGSIHQACIESGTSDAVRKMLAEALQTDVAMAPSANLFERGVKVQVLSKGTQFARRAARLYELYRRYASLGDLPGDVATELETKILQNSIEQEWKSTKEFFRDYDPAQLKLAETDERRRMGLVFRSYLGKSAKWAIAGDLSRQKDFQIWCGPSMGAFNEWAAGSFLEEPKNRNFKAVAMNLLFGACFLLRRQQIVQDLASCNRLFDFSLQRFRPMTVNEMERHLNPEG